MTGTALSHMPEIQRWWKEKQQQHKKEPVSDLHETYNLVEIIAINTLINTEITTNCDKENNKVK